MAVAFAVVACSRCRTPWSIELRHSRVACPRCHASVEVRKRRRLWEGDDAAQARQAAAEIAATMAAGQTRRTTTHPLLLEDRRPVTRHDDPLDAAAAVGREHRNASRRAEAVLVALTRLLGMTAHDDAVDALQRAGLSAERAEKEVIRMLATDHMYEPRVGHYQALSP